MHRLKAVGPVAIAFLLLPFVCFAQQTVYPPVEGHEARKIIGNVYYDGTNLPASSIMVQLSDSQGDAIAPVMTDSSGEFRFGGLNPGQYSVIIRADGCLPVNMQVDVSYNTQRGIAIYLKPLPSAKAAGPNSSISAHELSMPAKARDLMDSGKKKLYEEKNAKSSLEDFQEAAAAAPGYYEPHYQIGMAYMTLGERDDAEKSFRKAIEMSNDKYAEGEIGLGSLLVDKGNYSGGEKAIRRGIELGPTFWLGYYELGRALLNENRVPEAEKSANQAKALAPSALIVYRLLSNIHLKQKNYAALLDDLDTYIKLDPKSTMGIHAQQLRDQVAAKITKDKLENASESKP